MTLESRDDDSGFRERTEVPLRGDDGSFPSFRELDDTVDRTMMHMRNGSIGYAVYPCTHRTKRSSSTNMTAPVKILSLGYIAPLSLVLPETGLSLMYRNRNSPVKKQKTMMATEQYLRFPVPVV